MRKQIRFPAGWDDARVQRVLEHYEGQCDAEAVAEDEAAFASLSLTVVAVPTDLLPAVRALIAKRRRST